MAKQYIVRITGGTSDGPYNVYHTSINPNNLATDASNNLPASGLSYNYLAIGTGVTVSVPDNAASIFVYNVDCNIYSGNSILAPIVDLTVTYEGCDNDGDRDGRFIFSLNNALGDNLTLNESTISFQNNLPLTVRENNTTNAALPILPITITAGTLTGITFAKTTTDFPFFTSQFASADIIYNGTLFTGGTQWTMPNGQIVNWFTANNPQLNTNFEPDFGYDNTFCDTPTPTPTPTSTPTPTPSITPSSTPAPTLLCCLPGYTQSGGVCIAQPLSGVSGTTITFEAGDQNVAPANGTLFYTDTTAIAKPFTFVNNAQFNPATSGVTISNGQRAIVVDGTNFSNSNHSQIAQYFKYYDSNISGTPLNIVATGTTNVWRNSLNSTFMRGSIKYATGLNQWVGGRYCMTATTVQQIHLFLAADDLFSLKINGEWFFKRLNNNTFNSTNNCDILNTIGADGVIDRSSGTQSYAISWNHVFPITLQPGAYYFDYAFSDVFNFANYSCSGTCCTTATFEIYSGLTTSQLTGITTYETLTASTVFSTRNTIGDPQTVFANFGDTVGIYCQQGATMKGDCNSPYCETNLVPCLSIPTPTPTPLPTINLTRVPLPSFRLGNYASSGRITSVAGSSGSFFVLDGSFPILPGQRVDGTQAGYGGSISISVIGPSGGGCVSIAVAGVETHAETVPGDVVSNLTFTSAEYGGFTSAQRVEIRMQNFAC